MIVPTESWSLKMSTKRLPGITVIIIVALIALLSNITIFSLAQDDETDADGDGMSDSWEQANGLNPGNASDAADDNDNDGLNNSQEYNNGTNSTNPNNPDTDYGGVDDGVELANGFDPLDPNDDDDIDSDGDGMPDTWELEHALAPADASDAEKDADGDGYDNLHEYNINTDPNDPISPSGQPTDDDKMEKDEESTFSRLDIGDPSSIILIFTTAGVVILLVVLFVYTKMRREQLLEHKLRNRIFEYINKHPGTHYRGVMNDLDLHMGTLTHHLNMLEQQRFIKSYQDGMYRRFYPIDARIETGLILTEVQKRILHTIQDTPGISQTGVARELGITRKIVHYHIKSLTDAGFVHTETTGRESSCYYLGGLELDDGKVM